MAGAGLYKQVHINYIYKAESAKDLRQILNISISSHINFETRISRNKAINKVHVVEHFDIRPLCNDIKSHL